MFALRLAIIQKIHSKKREQKKKRVQILIRQAMRSLETVPETLLKQTFANEIEARNFILQNIAVSNRNIKISKNFISDLKPGLKHHDINCISLTQSFHALTGVSYENFNRLLTHLELDLKSHFPQSQMGPHISNYSNRSCTLRMRFFLTLYRLKHGVSFRIMESLFGWSNSVIQEWCQIITKIIRRSLYDYHEGMLDKLTLSWQTREATAWALRHAFKSDTSLFVDRIQSQNSYSLNNRLPLPFAYNELHPFIGSIGSIDGTFSLRPAIELSNLINNGEDTKEDRLYSEYVKEHANKLLFCISHGFTDPKGITDEMSTSKKLILHIEIGPGSCSDTTMQYVSMNKLRNSLHPSIAFLGDHAFHQSERVICPYTVAEINVGNSSLLQQFNYSHSQDRICSEHGIKFGKSWGVIRGRTDIRLFENEEYFKDAVIACWAIHNFCSWHE